ncbi:MAG: hypothetical protein GY841_08280, partial [FCB group bacterium]|nr:hypothetical protein [FCB group bacterium]
ISSNVIAEAAINPDFSQIEADAAQIDVNSTFALFYPERRPFFQEGSDIFRTLFNSFYTRTVNDPQLAAKVTGRMGGTTFGFFTAVDENSPYMIPLDQRSITLNTDKSVTNVLRGLQTVGDDSRIGVFFSDRRQDGGGSGSIAALDGNIRLSQNYRIDGQFIASHVDEPDDHSHSTFFPGWVTPGYEDSVAMILDEMEFDNGKHTVAFDGESYTGHAFISRLRRNGRNLNFTLDYNQVSPSYRTQTGFDPASNYRNASAYGSYTFYSEEGLLERITPQIYTSRRWNFDGAPLHKNIFFSMNNRLKFAQTFISFGYGRIFERYRGIEFDKLWEANVNVNSRINSQLGVGAFNEKGRGIARRLRVKGNETSLDLFLDFKPIDRLMIEPDVSYAKSSDIESGDELYKQLILRTRFRYQASRALSLRLVVQYNDSREMVNYASGETWHDKAWDIDPMIT